MITTVAVYGIFDASAGDYDPAGRKAGRAGECEGFDSSKLAPLLLMSIVWNYRVPGKDLTLQKLAESDLSLEEIGDALHSLTSEQLLRLKYEWRLHARPEQLPPEGDWQKWLYLGGRGAGKTRSGAEWIRASVEAGCSRLALIAATAADARDIMVLGESGIMAVSPPWNRPVPILSRRRLEWPSGAVATLYSADEPERLRGHQHDAGWCDEVCAWR
jgi:hypothetical protein